MEICFAPDELPAYAAGRWTDACAPPRQRSFWSFSPSGAYST